MPISIALLFCIPIGFLMYFELRWLFCHFLSRYEQKERRVARVFGVFGAFLIPIVYCYGCIEDAFPGRMGETVATGFLTVLSFAVVGLVARIYSTREKGE